MSMYNLENLIKQKTCFEILENPSCMDLVLTNCPRRFQISKVFEARISDFQKLTVTVFKQYLPQPSPPPAAPPIQKKKQCAKVLMFWYYRNFWHDEFRAELDKEILKCDLNNIEFHHFLKLFTQDSSKHVHLKKKYLKPNQQRFMTKELYKAIVNRSRLCNKFLRYTAESFRKRY